MNSPFASRLISRCKRPRTAHSARGGPGPGFQAILGHPTRGVQAAVGRRTKRADDKLMNDLQANLEFLWIIVASAVAERLKFSTVLSSVKRFETGTEQADDITILALRFSGA